MPDQISYRGRFAPSPTGQLHFGSLVAAVGSYLDAKHHNGIWLVRIDDLDMPRCVKGAADSILRVLEVFGLHSDEHIICQRLRTDAYEEALLRLQNIGVVYPCCCTRREISDSALQGIEGPVYPGTCRNGIQYGRARLAWRVRTDQFPFTHHGSEIEFEDMLQGRISQNLETEIGDFVVKRADGLFAYQLAAVVDDAFQGITNVVRGSDLLASTPRQIYLQRLLGFATPTYLHLPVAVNARGEKLSKQTQAPAIATDGATEMLITVLDFLRQQPPAELRHGSIEEVLSWAVAHWQPDRLRGCKKTPGREAR